MKFAAETGRGAEEVRVREAIEPVARGLGFSLVEVLVSRHRGACQVRVTVSGRDGAAPGVNECSLVHRAIIPRLELALGGRDMSVEVSSPGTGRLIKSGSEFALFAGRQVRCYLTDISGWVCGTVRAADERAVTLEGKDGPVTLPYERIGKARLGSPDD
ncbi:MAG: ribosome maturation factor RimP [Treponematales bacterium]